MVEIKVFGISQKMDEAFKEFAEKTNVLCEKHHLDYYELFGILECFKCDLINQQKEMDEE